MRGRKFNNGYVKGSVLCRGTILSMRVNLSPGEWKQAALKIDLLHKSLKPLPNPPLKGEGVRFLPPETGELRGVNSTFARGLIKSVCAPLTEDPGFTEPASAGFGCIAAVSTAQLTLS